MNDLIVDDSREINLGSDHSLILCDARTGRLAEGMSAPLFEIEG